MSVGVVEHGQMSVEFVCNNVLIADNREGKDGQVHGHKLAEDVLRCGGHDDSEIDKHVSRDCTQDQNTELRSDEF